MSELEQKILKNPPLEAFLEEKFHSLGFEQLTDIQKRALPIICQKIDSLVIAPTGSGKTECIVIQNFSQIKECQSRQDLEKKNHQNHSQNQTRKMAGWEKMILSN